MRVRRCGVVGVGLRSRNGWAAGPIPWPGPALSRVMGTLPAPPIRPAADLPAGRRVCPDCGAVFTARRRTPVPRVPGQAPGGVPLPCRGAPARTAAETGAGGHRRAVTAQARSGRMWRHHTRRPTRHQCSREAARRRRSMSLSKTRRSVAAPVSPGYPDTRMPARSRHGAPARARHRGTVKQPGPVCAANASPANVAGMARCGRPRCAPLHAAPTAGEPAARFPAMRRCPSVCLGAATGAGG